MLNEPAVALRTKAVKALTSIVSVDPNILERVGRHLAFFLSFFLQIILLKYPLQTATPFVKFRIF